MSDERKAAPRVNAAGSSAAEARRERLAEALRANLRRRKAQRRERVNAAPPAKKP